MKPPCEYSTCCRKSYRSVGERRLCAEHANALEAEHERADRAAEERRRVARAFREAGKEPPAWATA